MSVQAMAWGIEQQVVTEPLARLTLLCICNYAGADGDSIFPSIKRLTGDTGLSESTVRRKIQELVTAGLLFRSDPALVAAKIKRADRRPTCYRIRMNGVSGTGCHRDTPSVNGVSQKAPRGVTQSPTGCQSLTPDPSGSVRIHHSKKAEGCQILTPEPSGEQSALCAFWEKARRLENSIGTSNPLTSIGVVPRAKPVGVEERNQTQDSAHPFSIGVIPEPRMITAGACAVALPLEEPVDDGWCECERDDCVKCCPPF